MSPATIAPRCPMSRSMSKKTPRHNKADEGGIVEDGTPSEGVSQGELDSWIVDVRFCLSSYFWQDYNQDIDILLHAMDNLLTYRVAGSGYR